MPTVGKQLDNYKDTMTADKAYTHWVYAINAVDQSRRIATYGKTSPNKGIQKDLNKCGGLLSIVKLAVGS